MELTNEDTLRLNVLLANKPRAIRIDESRLVVAALSDRGEFSVELHPTGRAESYLRAVRELISGHILGSPGGYPVYLRRWTRMGQMRDESLEQLLMLGEPEAVVAAVCSPGLSVELGRRAWWAMQDADNARRMLANPAIVSSDLGAELADYLIDYLPFEIDSDRIMDSVGLVLQPGLISADKRDDLWRRSARKQAYLVGFLRALPDDLPDCPPPRADDQALRESLAALAVRQDPAACLLLRVTSGAGQGFLRTLSTVLAKPPNQDVLTAAFDLMRDYFSLLCSPDQLNLPIAERLRDAEAFTTATRDGIARDCLAVRSDLERDLAAMRLLSGVGYPAIRQLLPDPTALGSLMRRKLAPLLDPLQEAIARLRSPLS